MLNKLIEKMTQNYKVVPLFYVSVDPAKNREKGETGSRSLNLHPSLKEDNDLVEQLNGIVDHIQKNHDMGCKEVGLFYVNFDLMKYQNEGEKGSCTLNLHPSLKEDPYVVDQLNALVDHIRKNHNMEKLV